MAGDNGLCAGVPAQEGRLGSTVGWLAVGRLASLLFGSVGCTWSSRCPRSQDRPGPS